MSAQHTPGTAVGQAVNVTFGGTQAKYHAVGIHGTNVAVAITGLADADDGAINEANARRIAACWGYCEDLDTEGMQRAVEIGQTAKVFIDESTKKELELLAQRDALLAALKDVRSDLFMQIENRHGAKAASEYPSIIHAKVAIANVEGGAV